MNDAASKMSVYSDADWRCQLELASRIASRGYGEPVIELALRRKGFERDAARLVAASVTSCHGVIVKAQAQAQRDLELLRLNRDTERRAARAASLALSKLAGFFVFVIAGIGGGVIFGWSIGFSQGIDDGFAWAVRAIERLISG